MTLALLDALYELYKENWLLHIQNLWDNVKLTTSYKENLWYTLSLSGGAHIHIKKIDYFIYKMENWQCNI